MVNLYLEMSRSAYNFSCLHFTDVFDRFTLVFLFRLLLTIYSQAAQGVMKRKTTGSTGALLTRQEHATVILAHVYPHHRPETLQMGHNSQNC